MRTFFIEISHLEIGKSGNEYSKVKWIPLGLICLNCSKIQYNLDIKFPMNLQEIKENAI